MKSLKNHRIVITLVIIFFFTTISAFAKEYNVLDFGAKGDGYTIETKAIQSAVDEQKFKEIIVQE